MILSLSLVFVAAAIFDECSGEEIQTPSWHLRLLKEALKVAGTDDTSVSLVSLFEYSNGWLEKGYMGIYTSCGRTCTILFNVPRLSFYGKPVVTHRPTCGPVDKYFQKWLDNEKEIEEMKEQLKMAGEKEKWERKKLRKEAELLHQEMENVKREREKVDEDLQRVKYGEERINGAMKIITSAQQKLKEETENIRREKEYMEEEKQKIMENKETVRKQMENLLKMKSKMKQKQEELQKLLKKAKEELEELAQEKYALALERKKLYATATMSKTHPTVSKTSEGLK